MNDPRPAIAIGHVRLQIGNVATATDFFVKLGIRTMVAQTDLRCSSCAAAPISSCAPGKHLRVARSLSISWWMTLMPLMGASRGMAWTSRPSPVGASTIISRSRPLIVAR